MKPVAKLPANLYPSAEIARRMEARRLELGLSVEQAAELAGCASHWMWYKKRKGRDKPAFDVVEIGRFAARTNAPMGWPFIELSAARFLEKELGAPPETDKPLQ